VTGRSMIGKYFLFLAALALFGSLATLFLNGGRLDFEYPRIYGALYNAPGADILLGDPTEGGGAVPEDDDAGWRRLADVAGAPEAAEYKGVYWLR